ncbi:MAG: iduronate-2-sulfatase [Verrucomicrobiales bacterium]|nr:iduronate-2-sulfatase [Verrucomicrobiales bacterium]
MNFPRVLLSAFLVCLFSSFVRAADSDIKNVLFLVSDDLKAHVLGCYGDPVCETPNLDALAERGMVFERAYCQGTWCLPSRRSFMHSRYEGERGPTLGKHLIDNGFYSARVGKIFHMRVPGDIIDGTDGVDIPETWTEKFNCQGQEAHTPGLYRLLNKNIFTTAPEDRQSTRDPHRMFVSVEAEGDGSDQPDYKAAEKTVELLRKHGKAEKPFFIACGMVRPHYPSVAPAGMFEDYPFEEMTLPEVPEGDLDDIPKLGKQGTTSQSTGIDQYPDNMKRMWADYYTTVTFMDQQVGKILDELEGQGLQENTAVVFTSDHGYHLGEHHFWQKSKFHEDVTRVPLIVAAPGYEAGRSKSLSELVDIYPTICELVGVEIPESVQGKSLVPVLEDPSASVRDAAYSLDGKKGSAIRTADWTYMRYRDGSEELYDMVNDPEQFTNLAEEAEFAEKKAELANTLDDKDALAKK